MSTTHTEPARHALISGGTRGIGLAIARQLARKGYNLSLMYRRQRTAAHKAQQELSAFGVQVHLFKGDTAQADQVEAFCQEAVQQLGPIDCLVANAASGSLKPLMQQNTQSWDWTMRTNHLGVFLLIKHAQPRMTSPGSMIVLSSLGSRFAIPDYGFVGASKAAIEAMVRQAAYELGPFGIRVNAVCAGAVDTEALQHFPDGSKVLAASHKHSFQPLLVENVADVVVWLSGSDSLAIQGQTIVADCGHSLGLPS